MADIWERLSSPVAVKPASSQRIRAVFRPSKIAVKAPGVYETEIVIGNKYNPNNKLRVHVLAEITVQMLKFSHLVDGELLLPPLTVPSLVGSPPVTEWFGITNTSNSPLRVLVDVELQSLFSQIMSVEVSSREHHATMYSFEIEPNETVELRVAARIKAESRYPRDQGVLPPSIGHLKIYPAECPPHTIVIRGSVVQGPTFALIGNQLQFQNVPARKTHVEVFQIQNLSLYHPLKFSIEWKRAHKDPLAFRAFRIQPTTGTVEPGEIALVEVVQIKRARAMDSLFLAVTDEYAPESPQQIQIQVIDAHPDSPDVVSTRSRKIKPPKSMEKALPVLSVSGCSIRTGGSNRYEIDFGKQVCASRQLDWHFSIGISEQCHPRTIPVEYSLNTSSGSFCSWLSIERKGGIIESLADVHRIEVKVDTSVIGSYETYIVLSNCNNPFDLKFIRVRLMVITSPELCQKPLFQVVTTAGWQRCQHISIESPGGPSRPSRTNESAERDAFGPRNSHSSASAIVDSRTEAPRVPVVDYGEVLYSRTYSDRSLLVVNASSQPLEFVVSSTLSASDPTTLIFSLSPRALECFQTLHIPPNSSAQVFLHLTPAEPKNQDESPAMLSTQLSPCHFFNSNSHLFRCYLQDASRLSANGSAQSSMCATIYISFMQRVSVHCRYFVARRRRKRFHREIDRYCY